MEVIRIREKSWKTNNYLIIKDKKAVLIDGSATVEEVEDKINDAKLIAIFLTHAHFDHLLELDNLIKHFDCKVYVYKKGVEYLYDENKNISKEYSPLTIKNKTNIVGVEDGQLLQLFDNHNIKVLHTPGHSDCSVCYDFGDMMFTGDTLFSVCVGRNDLCTSSYTQQQETLKRLQDYPEKNIYYSGHGISFDYQKAQKVIAENLDT